MTDVSNNMNVSDNLTVAGNLDASEIDVSNNMTVNKNLTVLGTLNVSGIDIYNFMTDVSNNMNVSDNLTVAGKLDASEIDVSNNMTVNKNLTVLGTLNVSGIDFNTLTGGPLAQTDPWWKKEAPSSLTAYSMFQDEVNQLARVPTRYGERVILNSDGTVMALLTVRGPYEDAVKVYEYKNSSWSGRGTPIRITRSDVNCIALSSDGNILAIGEPELKRVSVYQFKVDDQVWLPMMDGNLYLTDTNTGFGCSISLTTDWTGVHYLAVADLAGFVRVYTVGSLFLYYLVGHFSGVAGSFGTSISMSKSVVLAIGSPGDNTVYLYKKSILSADNQWLGVRTINGTGLNDKFGSSVSICDTGIGNDQILSVSANGGAGYVGIYKVFISLRGNSDYINSVLSVPFPAPHVVTSISAGVNIVAVGFPNTNIKTQGGGVVYICAPDLSGTWGVREEFYGYYTDGLFGSYVSISEDGEKLAIGVPDVETGHVVVCNKIVDGNEYDKKVYDLYEATEAFNLLQTRVTALGG
jgi:phage baseplate assembly protein gpV